MFSGNDDKESVVYITKNFSCKNKLLLIMLTLGIGKTIYEISVENFGVSTRQIPVLLRKSEKSYLST